MQLIRHYRFPIFILILAVAAGVYACSINVEGGGAMHDLKVVLVKVSVDCAQVMLTLSATLFLYKLYVHWEWECGRRDGCYSCGGLIEGGLERSICLRCGKKQR